MAEKDENLSQPEFTRRAIKQLKDSSEKGIHSEYSGFNDAFRKYFDEDPDDAINKLSKKGVIRTSTVEGGYMLYLSSGNSKKTRQGNTLNNILDENEGKEYSSDNEFLEELSKQKVPLLIDEFGAHEVTKYSLLAFFGRIWIKDLFCQEQWLSLKVMSEDKEVIKEMDRSKTYHQWNPEKVVWYFKSSSLNYALNHFVENGYEIACSPSVSQFLLDDLNSNEDNLPSKNELRKRKKNLPYQNEKIEPGRIKSYTQNHVNDNPPNGINSGATKSNKQNKVNFSEGDVVEHPNGRRGKVKHTRKATLVVKRGQEKLMEWPRQACEFIREGK